MIFDGLVGGWVGVGWCFGILIWFVLGLVWLFVLGLFVFWVGWLVWVGWVSGLGGLYVFLFFKVWCLF